MDRPSGMERNWEEKLIIISQEAAASLQNWGCVLPPFAEAEMYSVIFPFCHTIILKWEYLISIRKLHLSDEMKCQDDASLKTDFNTGCWIILEEVNPLSVLCRGQPLQSIGTIAPEVP